MGAEAVVFIPGIKGTKLRNVNDVNHDVIWSGIQSNFESIQDLELTEIHNQTYYDADQNVIIEAADIEELAYGEFLHDLKRHLKNLSHRRNDPSLDKPIFIFNYDWRFSARVNGDRLHRFLEYLTAKSEAISRENKQVVPIEKFDFITHSLGNAVLRAYLKEKGFGRVNRVVFTVPPFRGSIDIASVALVGEGFFPNVKSKVRKLIRTFPGALELLPTYDGASKFTTGSPTHDFFDFNHWQSNATNLNKPPARKFKSALAEAKQTVTSGLCDLASLSKTNRQRILIIARHGYNTYQSIKVHRSKAGEPKNYFDFANAVKTEDGDGRVPHASSCCYSDDVLTLLIKDAIFFKDYTHGFVLKDERVQRLVNGFLFRTPGKGFDYSIPGSSVKKV